MLRFQMSGHNWQVIPLTPQVHAAPEVGFTWNVARFALLGTEIVSFSKDFLTEWFWNSGAPPASGPRRPWPRRPWPKARARAGRDTTGEVKWRSIHVDFFVVLFFQVGPSAYALPVPLAPASRRTWKILSNVVTCDGLCRCGDLQDF